MDSQPKDPDSTSLPPQYHPPWKEMFRTASTRKSHAELTQNSEEMPKPSSESHLPAALKENPQLSLALYIAMAHAGLVLAIIILFGITKLLEEYLRPIAWAVLCSMPLREIQSWVEEFWKYPLQLGVIETVLAIPITIFRSSMATVMDIVSVGNRIIRRNRDGNSTKIGFSKLVQWLVSFGFFSFLYENAGIASTLLLVFIGFVVMRIWNVDMDSSNSTLFAIHSVRRSHNSVRIGFFSKISRKITSGALKKLKTIIALGLISTMILGSLLGAMFFTYKVGMEGKEVVVSLRVHLKENDYAEKFGVRQWMEDNEVPKMLDTYSTKFYETVSVQIDQLAMQYNLTEVVTGFKQYMNRSRVESSEFDAPITPSHHYVEKLHNLTSLARGREWKGIYEQLVEIVNELIATEENFVEKAKAYALQGLDMFKQVFQSSKTVLGGGASFLSMIMLSVLSGASNFMNFISHSMVFFWLLYYLITSDSGGVMQQVLGMIPISQSARKRSADVLDHAVSSVLLATAKVAIFQGALTWLVFRFYKIHFLYMCTVLALISPLLPLIPSWLSSIPAAAQLLLQGRYVEAVVLTAAHQIVMDLGDSAIQDDVPGHSGYLTGLSILGGMALFSSPLEGAIMGPLLMTVMLAIKNLYSEFVLSSSSGKED